MCMTTWVYGVSECAHARVRAHTYSWKPEAEFGIPGTRGVCSCEHPDTYTGAVNWTQKKREIIQL